MKQLSFTPYNLALVRARKKTQTRRPIESKARNMQRQGSECIQHRAPGDKWYKNYTWSMRGDTGVWNDYTEERFLEVVSPWKVGDIVPLKGDPCGGFASIASLRVERLQEISEEDAVKEGCAFKEALKDGNPYPWAMPARMNFVGEWDSIYARQNMPFGWVDNPFVLVVDFNPE